MLYEVGLLSMIWLYWCLIPSLFYYLYYSGVHVDFVTLWNVECQGLSIQLLSQAYRPQPKAQAHVQLERVCHRSPKGVESSKCTDEVSDSALQLAGLLNVLYDT